MSYPQQISGFPNISLVQTKHGPVIGMGDINEGNVARLAEAALYLAQHEVTSRPQFWRGRKDYVAVPETACEPRDIFINLYRATATTDKTVAEWKKQIVHGIAVEDNQIIVTVNTRFKYNESSEHGVTLIANMVSTLLLDLDAASKRGFLKELMELHGMENVPVIPAGVRNISTVNMKGRKFTLDHHHKKSGLVTVFKYEK
ncbi:MAG: hypothetical protein HY053_02845 [Proteobacteria bacterium]|nr:hypothetical protein [Pseudomonadota bacterium]